MTLPPVTDLPIIERRRIEAQILKNVHEVIEARSGREEADAAIHAGDGEAKVTCEFCGQEYRVGPDRVDELFRQAAAEAPAGDTPH